MGEGININKSNIERKTAEHQVGNVRLPGDPGYVKPGKRPGRPMREQSSNADSENKSKG